LGGGRGGENLVGMAGRLTDIERDSRVKGLLEFVYSFRYPTREQIYRFSRVKWGIKKDEFLLNFCVRKGYLSADKITEIKPRLYQLTTLGKSYLGRLDSRFVQRGKRMFRLDNYYHDSLVLDVYLKLLGVFKEGTWLSDWRIRAMIRREHGLKASHRAPDGIFTQGEQNLAVEVERAEKSQDRISAVVGKYKREFEKGYICGVVLVTETKLKMYRLKKKLDKVALKWDEKRVIYAPWENLEKNKGEHLGKEISLGEFFKAFR